MGWFIAFVVVVGLIYLVGRSSPEDGQKPGRNSEGAYGGELPLLGAGRRPTRHHGDRNRASLRPTGPVNDQNCHSPSPA